MGFHDIRPGRLLPGMAVLVFLGTASAAPAQKILSAVESENTNTAAKDKVVSNTAGALAATTYGGADTRAYTDFGVNKVYASGNADYEQYATSAWVDSYTVNGAAGSMVNLTFTFSIDGMADFNAASDADFNFSVYALRGGTWSVTGYGDPSAPFAPFGGGDNYERVVLELARPDGGVTQMDARDFDGFYNYGPNASQPGEPGNFGTHVTYVPDGANSHFSYETMNGPNLVEHHLFSGGYQTYTNGQLTAAGPYSTNPALGGLRTTLQANYSLLDMDVLCFGGECAAGNYPGSDLTLSFSLAAGSTFSLASIFTVDDLTEGTVDFFHTAKVTGITVSGGATLTSGSGTLQTQSDGSYGYAAVAALPGAGAVPEPATWAMLLGGFALAGGMMRRRAAPSLRTALRTA